MNQIFLALIFIATPTFAQELNEFSNGSVADADAINENFQNLNGRIQTIEEAEVGAAALQNKTVAMLLLRVLMGLLVCWRQQVRWCVTPWVP